MRPACACRRNPGPRRSRAAPWSRPGYLHVHGFVFTAWIVFFLTQTTLVAARRRVLGWAGAGLAAPMVVVPTWNEFLRGAAGQSGHHERMEANEAAYIIATSGTTAKPKLAVHTHGGYQVHSMSCAGGHRAEEPVRGASQRAREEGSGRSGTFR